MITFPEKEMDAVNQIARTARKSPSHDHLLDEDADRLTQLWEKAEIQCEEILARWGLDEKGINIVEAVRIFSMAQATK